MNGNDSQKFSLKFFRVIWEPVEDIESRELVPRVNRQISPATQRNRVKRLLREFFRRNQATLKPGRWVFIGKARAAEVPNREIFHDLEQLLSKMSAAPHV